MSDYYPKIDARIMVLEREMPEVRKLASDASTEVGDLRGELRDYKRVLLALRQTQLDHYAETQQGFARVDEEMREGFAGVNAGMNARFDRQDDKFAMILDVLDIIRRESDES